MIERDDQAACSLCPPFQVAPQIVDAKIWRSQEEEREGEKRRKRKSSEEGDKRTKRKPRETRKKRRKGRRQSTEV